MRLEVEPTDLVYMPTLTHEDNEIEELYEQLDYLIEAEKGNNNLVIMADCNGIVGEGKDERELGAFGFGTRNESGERLVEFCRKKTLVVTNTCFVHGKRHRYKFGNKKIMWHTVKCLR